MFQVFEILIRIYLLKEIKQKDSHNVIADYIDSYLRRKQELALFHETNKYKNYVFDELYPIADQGVYHADSIYQFRIRTVDRKLADYFAGGLADHRTEWIKGLTRKVRTVSSKPIETVYTITPIIVKNPDQKGYWRDSMPFEKFEASLRGNLFKKYKAFTGASVDENIELYNQIELLNKGPIGVPYKGITLLGDKVSIRVAENESAQQLWYFALGTGLGTMNARGNGFLQYHYA